MAFTPKQERDNTNIGGETHQSAEPSADLTGMIGGVKGHSQDAVLQRMAEAHAIMFGSSAGFPPSTVPGVSGPFFSDLSNAPAVMWEWDANLAISEMPGEP